MRKKIMSILLSTAMVLSLCACGKQDDDTTEDMTEVLPVSYEIMEEKLLAEMEAEIAARTSGSEGTEEGDTEASTDTSLGIDGVTTEEEAYKESILFWYEDDKDIEYLQAAAAEFEKRYDIKVNYILKEEADILDVINAANQTGEAPDAYMLSNDQLQKARLAGLVEKNTLYDETFWTEHYPAVAKNALTSGTGVYGYPVNLDTYIMVYDQDMAGQPVTIENVLEFSDNFVDDSNEKEIFKWDISDPFYNIMFLGGYASLLGASGEDVSQFDVTNDYVVESMEYFQSMHEHLSMEMEESSYQQIKDKIASHKLIYAICKTDILYVLEETENSYKLAKTPKLTDTLDSGSLSITYASCVNPYAKSRAAATLFSIFLSYEYSPEMFNLTRKVACRNSINRENENDILIAEQYASSDTIPKALEMGDFWTYSEIAFYNIWYGEDVKTELQNLQDTVKQRLK